MELPPGTQLGSYKIIAPIGAGGMGEVYRATDSKLAREVAIKVLPEEFAKDEERLRRFRREARVLASLNHPNIASIHGFEETNGTYFLVLEFVAGETLADRLTRGPLPIDEAIETAVTIAEALEEAHEHGIVHRDLKPANIKLTPEDNIKVLDFGLAKALLEEGAELDSSLSPTITRDATRIGTILGTAAYMSPEQAKGKRVDRRSDIFAFGAVLYEMLTGKHAFDGENIAEVLASVIKNEPDFSALPIDVPRGVQHLLRRCLRKDVRERFRSAADVAILLRDLEASAAEGRGQASPELSPQRRLPKLGFAALLLLSGFGIGHMLAPNPTTPTASRHLDIALPPDVALMKLDSRALALSPNGSLLAFVARSSSGVNQLYLRDMTSGVTRPIPGTDGADDPFFSPDGNWIGFTTSGGIKRVSIHGGTPVTVTDVVNDFGASWGPDDMVVFSISGIGTGLMKVSAFGGTPEVLSRPGEEGGHSFPQVLPDGQSILVDSSSGIGVLTKQGTYSELLSHGNSPRYTASGHLIYHYDGSLYAIAYDVAKAEIVGAPVPVLENVWRANFDVGNDGTLVYLRGGIAANADRRLVRVDRTGHAEPLAAIERPFHFPRLSPDGGRLLVSIRDGPQQSDIWSMRMEDQRLERLTFGGNSWYPTWFSNGVSFAYSHVTDPQHWELRRQAMDGGNETLFRSDRQIFIDAVSPNGKTLSVTRPTEETGWDMFSLTIGRPEELRPYYSSIAYDGEVSFSPDGRWIAYTSEESGEIQVYVQDFPEGRTRWQISNGARGDAVWVSNGREIVFRDGPTILSVAVRTQPTFEQLSDPVPLFVSPYELEQSGFRNFDVSADGQFFVMVGPHQSMLADHFVVVLNWFQELERLVPTGNRTRSVAAH